MGIAAGASRERGRRGRGRVHPLLRPLRRRDSASLLGGRAGRLRRTAGPGRAARQAAGRAGRDPRGSRGPRQPHGRRPPVAREAARTAPGPDEALPAEPGQRRAPSPPSTWPARSTLLHYLVDERRPALVTWQAFSDDLGLTPAEVETDLSLINLVNFGGGTYALMARPRPDGVEVTRDVMADTFAAPARLSPVMARAPPAGPRPAGRHPRAGGARIAGVGPREGPRTGRARTVRSARVIVDDVLPPAPDIVDVLNHAIRDHSRGRDRLLHRLPRGAGPSASWSPTCSSAPRTDGISRPSASRRGAAYLQARTHPGARATERDIRTPRRRSTSAGAEPGRLSLPATSPLGRPSVSTPAGAPTSRTEGIECDALPDGTLEGRDALSGRALDGAGDPPLSWATRCSTARVGTAEGP